MSCCRARRTNFTLPLQTRNQNFVAATSDLVPCRWVSSGNYIRPLSWLPPAPAAAACLSRNRGSSNSYIWYTQTPNNVVHHYIPVTALGCTAAPLLTVRLPWWAPPSPFFCNLLCDHSSSPERRRSISANAEKVRGGVLLGRDRESAWAGKRRRGPR